jgi:uncharacterized protein involved in tolerance to divalent cations
MINVLIYLKKEHNAKTLIHDLLREKLISSASIDENNVHFSMQNDVLVEEIYWVITAQTKALLFNDINKFVATTINEETPIIAIPIVGSNRIFDELLRSKTISK